MKHVGVGEATQCRLQIPCRDCVWASLIQHPTSKTAISIGSPLDLYMQDIIWSDLKVNVELRTAKRIIGSLTRGLVERSSSETSRGLPEGELSSEIMQVEESLLVLSCSSLSPPTMTRAAPFVPSPANSFPGRSGYGLVFGLYVAFTPFCLFAASG